MKSISILRDHIREFSRQRLSVFWRTFILMLGLTVLMFVALDCSRRTSERTLMENYLQQAQSSLERNCQNMQTVLYNTYAIPAAIENSRYFNYIRTEHSGTLPQKYISVLPAIRKALANQLYLQGENEECILYFSGPNCICTRKRVFAKADDCFDNYILYSGSSSETLMHALQKENSVLLLPVQEMQIGSGPAQPCLTLIIRPRYSSIAVMSIYRLQTILNDLGMPDFPDGSVVTIENEQGDCLLRYPQQSEHTDSVNTLSVPLPLLHCTVKLDLPEDYFKAQLRTTKQVNWVLTLLFCLLGVLFSAILSKASSQPIVDLVNVYTDRREPRKGQNEILYLSDVLENARQESLALRSLLLSGLISRVFSGAVLTAEEEAQLHSRLGALADGYRIAIIHTGEECGQLQFSSQLRQLLPEECVLQPISLTQTGLILPENKTILHALENALSQLSSQQEQLSPACGVSAPIYTLSELHIAVRQARLAVPENGILGIYSGSAAHVTTFSWLQHERLYQSILSADEDGSLMLLQTICRESTQTETARETFYNVLFILRSAAGELELPLQQALHVEYDISILPRENMQRLIELTHRLFAGIFQKQANQQDTLAKQVLDYLHKNYFAPEICAASVAQIFGLSEKRVYTLVRRETDMSFSDYILQLRMHTAAELLCTTPLGTAEVSERCGYLAVNTFYRAFKKYYGITPSEFRKKGGIREDARNNMY